MQIRKIDRFCGAMVGTLCGDALGAPYEWKKAEDIKTDIHQRDGLVAHEYEPFDYVEPWKGKRTMSKGQPTDDTELAAALALSLVEAGGLNEENLFGHLRSFMIDRRSLLTERAYGSGSTLKAALTPPTYAESVKLFGAGTMPTPPSNGSLMRCIPIPLMFGSNIKVLAAAARDQSRVTHQNPLSVAACVAYTVLVSFVLAGSEPALAWGKTQVAIGSTSLAHEPGMSEVLKIPLWRAPDDDDIWPAEPRGPGDAVTSLHAALWASAYSSDFADGIIKVISLGGDTDTYGAIAGGILGAHFGIAGIPEKWTKVLQGREVMEVLASQLYDIALP